MSTSSSISALADYDLAFMVLCDVWARAQMTSWVLYTWALQSDITPVATYRAQCVRSDFCEEVSVVMFAAEPYVILCD